MPRWSSARPGGGSLWLLPATPRAFPGTLTPPARRWRLGGCCAASGLARTRRGGRGGEKGPEERRRFPPRLQARDVTHGVCPCSPCCPERGGGQRDGVPTKGGRPNAWRRRGVAPLQAKRADDWALCGGLLWDIGLWYKASIILIPPPPPKKKQKTFPFFLSSRPGRREESTQPVSGLKGHPASHRILTGHPPVPLCAGLPCCFWN